MCIKYQRIRATPSKAVQHLRNATQTKQLLFESKISTHYRFVYLWVGRRNIV